MKYSDKQTAIQINLTDQYREKYNPQTQDGVLIEFKDYGSGIKEKDLPYLFERFYRSDDVQRLPGTGLGLSIAQEFISLYQGEIFVKS